MKWVRFFEIRCIRLFRLQKVNWVRYQSSELALCLYRLWRLNWVRRRYSELVFLKTWLLDRALMLHFKLLLWCFFENNRSWNDVIWQWNWIWLTQIRLTQLIWERFLWYVIITHQCSIVVEAIYSEWEMLIENLSHNDSKQHINFSLQDLLSEEQFICINHIFDVNL